jgi:hypothetical protein
MEKQMSKFLVTSGCSFSTVLNHTHDLIQGGTWPHVLRLLTSKYQWSPIALGVKGQGNGLIARKLIQSLHDLLYQKSVSPKDIFVGVMWSGTNRIEKYVDDRWEIIHQGSPQYIAYHKWYGSKIGDAIVTIEHILRVQWFLERHGIKYFMTTYTDQVLPTDCVENLDVNYLYKQINFDNFLPIDGMYEWCRDHSTITFPVIDDIHPGFKQHREFTEKVILPFCYKNGLLEL